MSKNGAFVIILDDEEKVLIALRDDMPLWNLIGGGVEDSETFEETAIRETNEETGLNVEIIRQIGDYTKERNGIIVKSYLCKIIGGSLEVREEGILLKYFNALQLPKNMSKTQKERIYDYFKRNEEVIKRVEAKKIGNIEMLKNLPYHEIEDLDFWKSHPKVQERKKLGTLKYFPK